MPVPVRVSCWPGPALRLLVASAALLNGGCGMLPPHASGSAFEDWSRAVHATPRERAALMRDARRRDDDWQIAMLRSLPGEHHDPSAALRGLRGLPRHARSGERGVLARTRIAELESALACQAQVADLRARLQRIVTIEQRLDESP